MNDRILKQLAELSLTADGAIDENAREYVLTRLSRADIRRYVVFLKSVLKERRVWVRSASPADKAVKERMASLFPGKELRFVADPALGAGMQVEYGDNVINISVKNMIENTIRRLLSGNR